jgi:hypothetical protein
MFHTKALQHPSGNVCAALLPSHHPSCPRGFPVEHYKDNRPALVVAFWGLALILGRVQISQTDKKSDGTVFGSILNHVTVGRFADGEWSLGIFAPLYIRRRALPFEKYQIGP